MGYEIRVEVHDSDYFGRVKVEETEIENVFLDIEAGEVVIHDGERCYVVALRKPDLGRVGGGAKKKVRHTTFSAVGQ